MTSGERRDGGKGRQQGTRTLYDVLGVSPQCTTHELKQAYRERALALHPDTAKGGRSSAQEFIEICKAFETLSNPGSKASYDRSIGNVPDIGSARMRMSKPHGLRSGGSLQEQMKPSAFTEGVSTVEMQQRYRRQIFVPRNEEERKQRMRARSRKVSSARSSFGLLVLLPLCVATWGYSRIRTEF